jgi:hypothetical protein
MLSGIVLSAALRFAAADQPPATDSAQVQPVQTGQTAQAAAVEEPKMVCKYESSTGSRVQKVKVCRPADQKQDEQSTKLQRELAKNGDFIEPSGTFGN